MDAHGPTTTAPPAGWYGDPWQQATYRWWDGATWTAHVREPEPGRDAASAASDDSTASADDATTVDERPLSAFARAVAAHTAAEQEHESAARVEGDHFQIAQRFNPTLNEYDVTANGGATIARVRQKRMALRERIELWTDDAQTTIMCRIQARSVMDTRAVYDVLDARDRRIGTLRKLGLKSLISSTWEIRDAADELVATVSETSTLIAVLRRIQDLGDIVPVVGWAIGLIPIPFGFTFRDANGVVIGEHKRQFGLRDRYDLRLHPDPEGRFDRRLAIALGICLDALQAR